MCHLSKKAKIEGLLKRFHKFQSNSRIPESLEFFNSDIRIGFQGLILSGKTVPFNKTGQKLDTYREIPPIPKNSRILGISQFRSQNQVQWSHLSEKNNPHCVLGQKWQKYEPNQPWADLNRPKSAEPLRASKLAQKSLIMNM